MYCRYCILQSYFEHQHRNIYQNIDDLRQELSDKMAKWHGVVRFGTGEFADSLHAEEQAGCAVKVAEILEEYPNAIVEFKTKSAVVAPLAKIRKPEKVIIAFSLNAPSMVNLMECGTASLDERFNAAKQVLSMGFNVAFHFDPVFYFDGWEQEYGLVVDRIYSTVDNIEKLAWCSIGGFRSNPSLKNHLKEHNLHLPLFSGEMITGNDGKIRYFRSIRQELYRGMRDAFYRNQPNAPIYLCMESRELWDDCGLLVRIPNGLPAYLDDQAKRLLSI